MTKISWKHHFDEIKNTLWSLRNFCITWNLFREINYIVNSLLKKLFSRKFFKKSWYKNFVNSTVCTMCRNLLSHIFAKETVSLKKLQKSCFNEIFSVRVNFSFVHTTVNLKEPKERGNEVLCFFTVLDHLAKNFVNLKKKNFFALFLYLISWKNFSDWLCYSEIHMYVHTCTFCY